MSSDWPRPSWNWGREPEWYSPISKTMRVAKNSWKIINTVACIWCEKKLEYLPAEMICFSKHIGFIELCCSLIRTSNVQGQKSEYVFAPNVGHCLFYKPSTSLLMCMWCPIGILMMTPLGSSQQNNLQLCVTDSTDTTLQSHNLDSVIENSNTILFRVIKWKFIKFLKSRFSLVFGANG